MEWFYLCFHSEWRRTWLICWLNFDQLWELQFFFLGWAVTPHLDWNNYKSVSDFVKRGRKKKLRGASGDFSDFFCFLFILIPALVGVHNICWDRLSIRMINKCIVWVAFCLWNKTCVFLLKLQERLGLWSRSKARFQPAWGMVLDQISLSPQPCVRF